MTAEECKAFCLRQLDTHEWQKEQPDLAASYRERYASGGWSEEDLATLVTLHMLHGWCERLADDYTPGRIDTEDDRRLICYYVWRELPVRDELRGEVLRKCIVEHKLEALEDLEIKPDDPSRLAYEESLANARADVIAASFGILPWTPERDEWRHGDIEGVTTKS